MLVLLSMLCNAKVLNYLFNVASWYKMFNTVSLFTEMFSSSKIWTTHKFVKLIKKERKKKTKWVSKMSGASFLQKVFNKISLQKNEKIWLSSDDNRLEDRLRLLAEFPDSRFSAQLKLDSAANAKNGKLSAGLREKGNLCYAQGDSERALQVCCCYRLFCYYC